jgi:hypothetical protein
MLTKFPPGSIRFLVVADVAADLVEIETDRDTAWP